MWEPWHGPRTFSRHMSNRTQIVTFSYSLPIDQAEDLIEILQDEEERQARAAAPDCGTPSADRRHHAMRAGAIFAVRRVVQAGSNGFYAEKTAAPASPKAES